MTRPVLRRTGNDAEGREQDTDISSESYEYRTIDKDDIINYHQPQQTPPPSSQFLQSHHGNAQISHLLLSDIVTACISPFFFFCSLKQSCTQSSQVNTILMVSYQCLTSLCWQLLEQRQNYCSLGRWPRMRNMKMMIRKPVENQLLCGRMNSLVNNDNNVKFLAARHHMSTLHSSQIFSWQPALDTNLLSASRAHSLIE